MNIKYPNTAAGAIKSLVDQSSYKEADMIKATPDPYIDGVWLIEHKEGSSIVYLNGYLDEFGEIRTFDDFEDVE